MTNNEYKALLDSLDRYYHYTDDHKVFTREQNKWNEARSLAKSNQEFKQMYDNYMAGN